MYHLSPHQLERMNCLVERSEHSDTMVFSTHDAWELEALERLADRLDSLRSNFLRFEG